jgi:hypothetical protein
LRDADAKDVRAKGGDLFDAVCSAYANAVGEFVNMLNGAEPTNRRLRREA